MSAGLSLSVSWKQAGRWLAKKGWDVVYVKDSMPVARDPITDEWLTLECAVETVICREEDHG